MTLTKENRTCGAARGCKTEGGIGTRGEEEGPVARGISSVVATPFDGSDIGDVDGRSDRGAGKGAVAILGGRTNVVDKGGSSGQE
eukprot:scaffold29894_cov76-Amphora_coffeaeformis.AAC.1